MSAPACRYTAARDTLRKLAANIDRVMQRQTARHGLEAVVRTVPVPA